MRRHPTLAAAALLKASSLVFRPALLKGNSVLPFTQ